MFCGLYFERMHVIQLIELIWILFKKVFSLCLQIISTQIGNYGKMKSEQHNFAK